MTTEGLNRPFVDIADTITAETLDFYTDATKGETLGMGGIFKNQWYFAKWEHDYIKRCDPSIEYLELLGVCMGVFIWAHQLKHRRIILFCDNQTVATMINKTTSKCKNCMLLIRKLVLLSLKLDMQIFCKWVPGKNNEKSDMLSRQKIDLFKKKFLTMDKFLCRLHDDLWPASKIWVN